MSVRPSVRLKLKISVTTEPIGFYSLGNISSGPVVVLSYFLGGEDTNISRIIAAYTGQNKILKKYFSFFSYFTFTDTSSQPVALGMGVSTPLKNIRI